jgi:hypothetical protein
MRNDGGASEDAATFALMITSGTDSLGRRYRLRIVLTVHSRVM